MSDRIDILLATYNGERFLAEQLDSIIVQTHTNWRILARDDGSGDGTVAILEAYRARHPSSIEIVHDGHGNLGSVGNFSALLEASKAPYVAFCDQDDVWQPEKLTLGLAAVKALEAQWGAATPCLSFSDLTVVDQALNPIAPSFWRREHIDPARASQLSRLLAQNVVTGCTAVLNRALAELASPIPSEAMVHDWWVALTAAAFGQVKTVPQPTMLYRQHGRNETGSRGYSVATNLSRLRTLIKTFGRKRPIYARQWRQATAFERQFEQRLDGSHRELIQAFVSLPDNHFMTRAFTMRKRFFLPTGLIRALSFSLFFNTKNTH